MSVSKNVTFVKCFGYIRIRYGLFVGYYALVSFLMLCAISFPCQRPDNLTQVKVIIFTISEIAICITSILKFNLDILIYCLEHMLYV